MKAEKGTVYVCSYCGERSLDRESIERCEVKCAAKHSREQAVAEYLRTHKPKYAEGDILRICGGYVIGYANRFFVVTKVVSPYYPEEDDKFYYGGEVGYDDDDEFSPYAIRLLPEDQVELVMTAQEYQSTTADIRKHLPKRYSLEYGVCQGTGDEFSIQVNVFPAKKGTKDE